MDMILIRGIGHLAFGVTNLEESVDFYCGLLGFSELFRMTNNNGVVTGIYVKVAHEQYLELFKAETITSSKTQSYRHLCLHVDDVEAVIQHVKTHNYPVDSDIKMGKDGNYQAWISDPGGNRIEFMQLMPNSKQRKSDPV